MYGLVHRKCHLNIVKVEFPSSLVPGTAGASSALTISADAASVQNLTYTFVVVGKSGRLSHSASMQLTVTGKH